MPQRFGWQDADGKKEGQTRVTYPIIYRHNALTARLIITAYKNEKPMFWRAPLIYRVFFHQTLCIQT